MPEATKKSNHVATTPQKVQQPENMSKNTEQPNRGRARSKDLQLIPLSSIYHLPSTIIGREVGEKGMPYLQGFVNLKVKKPLAGIKEMDFSRAARGADVDNEKYCSKDEDIYLDIGEPSAQGKRMDLDAAVEMLRASNGDLCVVATAMPLLLFRMTMDCLSGLTLLSLVSNVILKHVFMCL